MPTAPSIVLLFLLLISVATIISATKQTMTETESKPSMRPPPVLLLTDMDGTLVHYESDFDCAAVTAAAQRELRGEGDGGGKEDGEGRGGDDDARAKLDFIESLMELPKSKTGKVGYVSLRTIKLLRDLKTHRPHSCLCLISGGRMETVLGRLDKMNQGAGAIFDVVVCENGGRMFKVDASNTYREDLAWGRKHDSQMEAGSLSKAAASFEELGHTVDSQGYARQIRVSASSTALDPSEVATLLERAGGAEGSLTFTVNLGHTDVYPATSGKKNAGRYVLQRLLENSTPGEEAPKVFVCGDDDNDIDLAKASFVTHSFFPRKTGERVKGGEINFEAEPESGLPRHSFTGVEVKEKDGWERLRNDVVATEIMLTMILSEVKMSTRGRDTSETESAAFAAEQREPTAVAGEENGASELREKVQQWMESLNRNEEGDNDDNDDNDNGDPKSSTI